MLKIVTIQAIFLEQKAFKGIFRLKEISIDHLPQDKILLEGIVFIDFNHTGYALMVAFDCAGKVHREIIEFLGKHMKVKPLKVLVRVLRWGNVTDIHDVIHFKDIQDGSKVQQLFNRIDDL